MDAITYLQSEWKVISEAPVTFVVGAIIVAAGAYWLARLQFTDRLATADARLTQKDDQLATYRDQLDGASPEEVRDTLDSLRQEVETNKFRARRQLAPRDIQRFSDIVSREDGTVTVIRDLRSASAKRLCLSLLEAFRAGGWSVNDGWNEGINVAAPVVLVVADDANLLAGEAAVRDALQACEIEFVIQGRDPSSGGDRLNPSVYINSESLRP